MYAIIESCGKQYKVTEGDIVFFEKLEMSSIESQTIHSEIVGVLKTASFSFISFGKESANNGFSNLLATILCLIWLDAFVFPDFSSALQKSSTVGMFFSSCASDTSYKLLFIKFLFINVFKSLLIISFKRKFLTLESSNTYISS